MFDRLGPRLRAADKVALLLHGVAPHSIRIPVPRLDMQLSVLAITYRLPSRAEDLLEYWPAQDRLDVLLDFRPCCLVRHSAASPRRSQAVHSGAQRAVGAKQVDDVGGRGIDGNGLSRGTGCNPKQG